MRKAVIVVLLGLFSAGRALAETEPLLAPHWAHTLPISQGAVALVAEAVQRSSILTALLRKLEQTDLVVYVTDVMPTRMPGPASYLTFLSRDATARYLLIRIDHWRVSSPRERIALLGHELQHALEVAAAPEVTDPGGLARLYRRIGWEGQRDQFETEAAQTMGNRVRREVGKSDDRKRGAVIATSP
jgi:hypothetical protein